VMDGTDDGSQEFRHIRDSFEQEVRTVDVTLDPLAVIQVSNQIEYSIYRHLDRFADTVQVEVNRIRSALLHPRYLELVHACQVELDRIRDGLQQEAADLVAVAGDLRKLQDRVAKLEVRIETELRREEAQTLRQRAVAKELHFKEYFVKGQLLPTEEDIYQRAVRVLGEGRIKLEQGDYSGAVASFEYSLEQFSKLKQR
jgi:hypothetical protein